MIQLSFANFVAYCGQILIVVSLAVVAARLLDLPLAHVRLAYWRAVLVLCLTLPLLALAQHSIPEFSTPLSTPAPVLTEPISRAAADTSAAGTRFPGGTFALALLLAGIWLRGAWLAVGFARLGRLKRNATPVDLSEDLMGLHDEIAPQADIRACGRSTQPATFGFWRPVILLPKTVSAMPAGERLAVVCHELVHVRRRDWLWTVAEEALRTVFWFHPAMRYAISRVQAAREEVVDAEVIERTGSRRDYMQALLAFAEAPPSVAAAAFVRPSQLSSRLRRMTEEVQMSRPRVRVIVSMLASALVAAVALAGVGLRYDLRAEQQAPPPPANSVQFSVAVSRAIVRMDRPVYPPEAWQAGIGAEVTATIRLGVNGLVTIQQTPTWRITVTDTSPMADVQNFWARQGWRDFVDSVTSAVSQWQFVPGDAETTSTLRVMFNNRIPGVMYSATTTSSASGVPDTGRPGQIAVSAPPPIRVGGAVRPPTKIVNIPPVYPADAKTARVQGVVIIEALIGTDGAVHQARVLRSIPLLDQAAVDAVSQWRFTPTLLNGVARDVMMTVTVNFSLAEQQ